MLITGLAWHRDGKSIIFAAQPAFMLSYLYRVRLEGDAPPERIEMAGPSAYRPSTSAGSDRLAFAQRNIDWDIWRLRRDGVPEPLIRSSFADYAPDFSPDGQRVAFTSNRNGESCEVWVVNAEGTCPPAHARTGTQSGHRAMVARWPVDRVRLSGCDWPARHLRHRVEWRPTAAHHLRAVEREPSPVGRATANGSTSARVAPAETRSGERHSREDRRSR